MKDHGFLATKEAWRGEADGLHRAGCFGPPEPLPDGRTAVNTRMLLAQKADGRHKARLVARGDEQVDGGSYDSEQTYSPVMHRVSFRLLMGIASATRALVHTIDVNLAFLYAKVDTEIHLKPPRGVFWGRDSNGAPLVRRALKALY